MRRGGDTSTRCHADGDRGFAQRGCCQPSLVGAPGTLQRPDLGDHEPRPSKPVAKAVIRQTDEPEAVDLLSRTAIEELVANGSRGPRNSPTRDQHPTVPHSAASWRCQSITPATTRAPVPADGATAEWGRLNTESGGRPSAAISRPRIPVPGPLADSEQPREPSAQPRHPPFRHVIRDRLRPGQRGRANGTDHVQVASASRTRGAVSWVRASRPRARPRRRRPRAPLGT